MDAVLYIIAGPLFLISIAAHLYVKLRLRPKEDPDSQDYYYEFDFRCGCRRRPAAVCRHGSLALSCWGRDPDGVPRRVREVQDCCEESDNRCIGVLWSFRTMRHMRNLR
ncbi:MAG: hypothetical protein ACYTAO_16240 [Planctomycetota bacterium]|jgi:hypothetical protein